MLATFGFTNNSKNQHMNPIFPGDGDVQKQRKLEKVQIEALPSKAPQLQH